LLIFLIAITGTLNAQIPDSTGAADKNSEIVAVNSDEMDPSRDRIIVNLHWDGWLGAPDSLNVKGLSSGIGFHFFYDIPLGESNFSFATGAGLSWSNFYHNGLFSYDTAQNTIFTPFPDSITFNKNKLVINYFEIPVEFRFRTDPRKGNSFKIAIGFKGGYTLSDHTKYVGEDFLLGSDDEIKFKTYRSKNLSNLQYGPTFRIGYSKVNLEAYYGLAEIFEEGKGPTGNPLTIGVSFNPF
jgi:hypothetical protein